MTARSQAPYRRLVAAVLLACAVASTVRAADDDADVVVRKWLALAPVDAVARRTLRADAVFARHLLDRAAPPPKEGEEITGTLGAPAKWAVREADEDGDVDAQNLGWAYASVESPTDGVVVAKLEGAGLLFVNGAGFPGDVYRLGDAGVPVALRKGVNDVYVAGPRGGFRLTLVRPESVGESAEKLFAGSRDVRFEMRRDLVPGAGADVVPWRAMNTSLEARPATSLQRLVPLGVCRGGSLLTEHVAPMPTTAHRRALYSSIDGSLQSYALVPPTPSDIDKSKVGLVLALHGAGVECMDLAKAYAPKPDFWIVCPTNRGRYGFDWQDWGRLDAYEVLEAALKVTGVDPRRVYLTGHSMGGHGTWHLAANDPGRFLAIAPSAGWSSFESYGAPKLVTPLAWMWRAADGASRTLDLVENLAQVPTYVLHGEKDDNVPASEARLMIDAVTKAGGKVESHFEPDAGHWWDKDEKAPGADCVDWPGIWELFRKTEPNVAPSREISFTTTDTWFGVDGSRSWVIVDHPQDYGRPSRVTAKWDESWSVCTVTTENVRVLRLLRPIGPDGPATYVIDGKTIPWNKFLHGSFERIDGTWVQLQMTTARRQHDWPRHRPFKRAFTNRFLLVYGTAGDDAEDLELLEKARCDSEVWAYRANGDANLMSDEQFLAGDFTDRNVIVYGNADTNKAWSAVFDDDCPIQAKRGVMTVNGTKHEGVVAAAFVRPRKGSDKALAAAFADTGAAATRMFYAFPVFSSGVGIPDYVVFGPGFLREWDGDVRAAGWFDYAWR